MKIKAELGRAFQNGRFQRIFMGTALASLALFYILTILFPFSSLIFFNYYLKEAFEYFVQASFIMLAFSLLLAFTAAYSAYRYRAVLKGRLPLFFGIIALFYILTYILMLGNTSFSLFSFTDMNGFEYTFLNFIVLAPIIPFSALLITDVYDTIRNARTASSGIGGLLAGAFSLGCPACGAFLYSILGIGASLSAFPLQGFEIKLFSLGLVMFSMYNYDQSLNSNVCKTDAKLKSKKLANPAKGIVFQKSFDTIVVVALILSGLLIGFNQLQMYEVADMLNAADNSLLAASTVSAPTTASGSTDLSAVDVSQISSTPMAIAAVFPELKNAKADDVAKIMLSSGTPEYSEAMGGITFDDVPTSLAYLSKWYFVLKDDIKKNNPEIWQRYLNLAAAPRGISCEFCCGVGPQGITEDGSLRCGCAHNIAAQALTLGLMKYTNYSDAEILREVMRWKSMYFPRNMVSLGVQVAGQDPSKIGKLP